jgi:DNA mismatch endonuclease, patch repair protein
MDRISREHRSWNMSRIRSKGTGPELQVRRILRKLRLRYRSQQKLPGTPDFVLTDHKTAVFVHGCFWHRHSRCNFAYTPKTRAEFWNKKFADNRKRDRAARRKLLDAGWNVVTVWECQTRSSGRLASLISGKVERRADR